MPLTHKKFIEIEDIRIKEQKIGPSLIISKFIFLSVLFSFLFSSYFFIFQFIVYFFISCLFLSQFIFFLSWFSLSYTVFQIRLFPQDTWSPFAAICLLSTPKKSSLFQIRNFFFTKLYLYCLLISFIIGQNATNQTFFKSQNLEMKEPILKSFP